MVKVPKISGLLGGFKIGKPSEKKPTWGTHSHIDMLADGLVRDRDGWVVEQNSIRRNGVVISWKGPLASSSTSVTVEMDGQRFPITSDETRKLRERLGEFLKAGNSG
jgi:hypothetical protein